MEVNDLLRLLVSIPLLIVIIVRRGIAEVWVLINHSLNTIPNGVRQLGLLVPKVMAIPDIPELLFGSILVKI